LVVALSVLGSWSALAIRVSSGISLTLPRTLNSTALTGEFTLFWITRVRLALIFLRISNAGSGAHGLASILIISLIRLFLISCFLVCHNTLLLVKVSGSMKLPPWLTTVFNACAIWLTEKFSTSINVTASQAYTWEKN
jgi:hypothetical protein